jgi:hypothetical protein
VKIFGAEMAPSIVKFRMHVAGQLVDLKTGAAVAQPTPEEAASIVAMAIGVATGEAQKMGKTLAELVPAFAWYSPKDMPRLTTALLPDAPQAFVDALTEKLVAELTGQEKDEDDGDDDDDEDEKQAPAAA